MEAVKAVRIGRALAEADLIVIGASNGLDLAGYDDNGKVAILELGVGLRNRFIKRALAQIANACEHATYILFNYSQAMAPDASCETILVDGDMAPAFEEVVRCRL